MLITTTSCLQLILRDYDLSRVVNFSVCLRKREADMKHSAAIQAFRWMWKWWIVLSDGHMPRLRPSMAEAKKKRKIMLAIILKTFSLPPWGLGGEGAVIRLWWTNHQQVCRDLGRMMVWRSQVSANSTAGGKDTSIGARETVVATHQGFYRIFLHHCSSQCCLHVINDPPIT